MPGGGDQGEIGRWESLFGGMFQHMHHYCAGLVLTNRAFLLSVGSKNFDLTASVVEFNYVIERAPPDFVLLPEILTRKGENLLQLDRATDGVGALLRATQLKPDYWPPYAVLSDYFKKLNNIAAAQEWIKKGLVAAPDSKALLRRQFELGLTQAK